METPKLEKISSDLVKGGTSVGIPKKKNAIGEAIDHKIDNIVDQFLNTDFKPSLMNLGYSTAVSAANWLHDLTIKGINRAFNRPVNSNTTVSGYTPYNIFSGASTTPPSILSPTTTVTTQQSQKPTVDQGLQPSEIIFNFESDANNVMYACLEQLSRYGVVGLDFFFERAGYRVTDANWNISYFGWRNLNGMHLEPSGNGWVIMFPPYTRVR